MTSQRPLLLLADDDERILDLVARFARRAGFDVVTCAGEEAPEELRRRPADLAMVDPRLPDVNGLDVLRATPRPSLLKVSPLPVSPHRPRPTRSAPLRARLLPRR